MEQRQAVILIHGIGEQRPMDTLRGFVDAVLDQSASDSQADARYYSKPDFLSGNFELRRLVSAGGRDDRTDFYEFYWAHLMPTAAWDRLASWYWVLMYRRPRDVPAGLRGVWAASWLVLLAVVALGTVQAIRFLMGEPVAPGMLDKAPWLILAVLAWLSMAVRNHLGDAAVYLSPTPRTIEARQKIRAAGLDLLDKVRASGRYDRVIVVGHSLGSVIGYDVLTFAWQRHGDAMRARISAAWAAGACPAIAFKAVRAAEVLTKAIRDAPPQDAAGRAAQADRWRAATPAVAAEMRANGDDWAVTDFVTLGSPLSHGDLLLARNRADFGRRARERELPHCPPVRELTGRFSFEHRGVDGSGRAQRAWLLNHGAVFAATTWTNLYFPCLWLLKGDLVGGPVSPLFWAGVRDIAVTTTVRGGWLAHTAYWTRSAAGTSIPALRRALDLRRDDAAADLPKIDGVAD